MCVRDFSVDYKSEQLLVFLPLFPTINKLVLQAFSNFFNFAHWFNFVVAIKAVLSGSCLAFFCALFAILWPFSL